MRENKEEIYIIIPLSYQFSFLRNFRAENQVRSMTNLKIWVIKMG